jgi:hypothetical protein
MDEAFGFKLFVCAGAIVLVADEVSGADKCDSLDALLYSQTAAARKVADYSLGESWCHANKMAMRITGALLLDNPGVSLPPATPGHFSLLGLAQQVIHKRMPSSAIWGDSSFSSLLERATAALARDTLQKHVLHEQRWIRFMLAVISPELNITTVMIAFEFDEPIVDHVLEHRFSTEKVLGNVSIDIYRALADPDDYELSRQTIISLLGERRQEQIIALP